MLSDWENLDVIGNNKRLAHATLIPYNKKEHALTGKKNKSENVMSLNGTWKFKWSKNPAQRPNIFFKSSFDDTTWDTITGG